MLWLAAAYSLYFHHIAPLETQTTESREVDAFPTSDDNNISELNVEQDTSIITVDNSTISEKRSSSILQSLLSIVSLWTKKFIPGSVSEKSTSLTPVTPKPVTGKPVAVKTNSSASAKSAPIPEHSTKDPMDVYSDMGGIAINQSDASTPVNPHPFNFTLNPENTCDVGPSSELFLLVYVHTRPGSIKQRELIRSTWGDVRNYYPITVRRIFVMGLPDSEYVQDAVNLESNLYHDIVQENFLDTYRNLTYKAVGALRWVKDYCSNAKFVLKTDDDAFVNMHVLLDLLVSKHKSGVYGPRSLVCNAWYSEAVPRVGKWAVTLAQRKHPTWPTFCQGLAYIMTPRVAAELYNASFDVPFLWMDDVCVTGFLAKKVGIVHTPIAQHFVSEGLIEKQLMNQALWKKALFSHVHNFDLRRWAWNRVMKLKNNSSTSTTIGNPLFSTTTSTKVAVPQSNPFLP